MRPIDAEYLDEKAIQFPNTSIWVPIEAVWDAPNIDAVPVVRCKDCKYVRFTLDGRLICGATLNPNWVSKDHFCSYGETER